MFDLPNNLEAEQTVIGSILIDPALMDGCTLEAKMFFHDGHQIIFEAMAILHENEEPINQISIMKNVTEDLTRHGGADYLKMLRLSVSITSNFAYFAKIVKDSWITREVMRTMRERLSYGDSNVDPTKYLTETINALESLTDGQTSDGMKRLSTYTEEHEQQVRERKEKKGLTGAKSCSEELNKMMGGYQGGDFTVLAARPSMGKTAMALNEAVSAADDYLFMNVKGCVYLSSLEMGALPMVERVICIIGGLDSNKLRTGEMDAEDWRKYNIAKRRLDDLPFYINESSGQTIQDIEQDIKQLRKRYDKCLVIIDFLQLVEVAQKNLEGHVKVAYVSQRCKKIARKYNVPVIGISAVGRGVEQRQDKRPMMSDLRESGSIESDADNIIFLYRDDYYDKESTKKAIVELIVAKGRNIGVGTIEMAYVKNTNRFLNLDYGYLNKKREGEKK